MHGCIINLLEHMDDEYTKILQNVDARATDYIEKLRYETQVYELFSKLNRYLEAKDYNSDDICRAYLRKVEHMYYRFDHGFDWDNRGDHAASEVYGEMKRLCRYILSKDQTDRLRTRAILCHIYFLALHDHWYEARDMMAMSALQNSIDRSDASTQILYNRATVQLGLCAFRKGFIKDSHQSLADLQGSGRVKELLAQGIAPNRYERTKEEENREKARLLPYNQHVNLELMECVYLVSAMLTDVNHCLSHYPDGRRRMISRNFHHVLKSSDRQTLVGSPETMRDHVVAASKALFIGDWQTTVKHIVNAKMNSKVWDLFHDAAAVKEMLTEKIKIEALRTFLLGHSSICDSLSLPLLEQQFDLDIKIIHQIISKMILMDEFMASLDDPTNCLIMHRSEPSKLQAMALRLAERVNQLGELNERLVEIRNAVPMPLKASWVRWVVGGFRNSFQTSRIA